MDKTLVYELTSGENLVDVSPLIPPVHARSTMYPGFRVKDASADHIAGEGSNGAQVTINWEFKINEPEEETQPDPELPPWQWPIQNYQASGVEVEEAIRYIWDNNGTKKEFQSTAGTELIGSYPRGLRQVSFSYHLQNFNESIINNYIGKINNDAIMIASVNYAAKTVLMKSITATPCIVKNDDNTTKWRYYRIDVVFLVDAQTFVKEYLNMSTFYLDAEKKGPAQIWTCEIDQNRYFGSLGFLEDRINQISDEAAKETMQAVSEPMFLDESGKINDIGSDGTLTSVKQTPTYITGSPYEPVDFSGLNLPASKGMA